MGNATSEQEGDLSRSRSLSKRLRRKGRRKRRHKGAEDSKESASDMESASDADSDADMPRSHTMPHAMGGGTRMQRSQSMHGLVRPHQGKYFNASMSRLMMDHKRAKKRAVRTDLDILESLNNFDDQLKLRASLFLHITSFARPLDQLHLAQVCKQFRHLIYHRMFVPRLKSLKSIQYYNEKYSVYYDQRRKAFKLNLTDSLDVAPECRLRTKIDKRRFILFLIFQKCMTNCRFKRKLKPGKKELVDRFEDTYAHLERLEVAWFEYGKERPLCWLESVLVSPYTSITILDFSESSLDKPKMDGLVRSLNLRLGFSPLTIMNFTGNKNIDDDALHDLIVCIVHKMPYLKNLYLDHTSISDGTCEALHFLYSQCTYINDRKSLMAVLPPDCVKDHSTRLRRVGMEGTKVNAQGVRSLDAIFTEKLVQKGDQINFYVKLNWSGEEAENFKRQCDPRIKFY